MSTIQQEEQAFPFVINGENTPHIGDHIFQYLDLDTLKKLRLVSKDWKDHVDCKTSFWSNILAEGYITAAGEGRIDICSHIIQKAENKNPFDWHGFTPMHAAAENGQWRICQLILDSTARHRRGKLKFDTNQLNYFRVV